MADSQNEGVEKKNPLSYLLRLAGRAPASG
jgi:hypothetical protein